jgi:uncharacterized protein DUF1842
MATLEGTFLARYAIGDDMLGAVKFDLQLVVDVPNKRVTGVGHLSQATNPPLNLSSQLSGDFSYMTVMPKNTHILVVAEGDQSSTRQRSTGSSQAQPNVELRMVLADDWKSGTASYKYRSGDGEWKEVTGAPVKTLTPTTL